MARGQIDRLESGSGGVERRLEDSYCLLEHRLGLGAFSEVRLAIKRPGNERVAVKVANRRGIEKDAAVLNEIRVLSLISALRSPYLVHLLDVFENERSFMLVFELLPNGSLLDRLQRDGKLEECETRGIVLQLASGLQALHVCEQHLTC